ncbi:hypothetical protein BHM03_00020103 [Ensete ventricosum]|nr:hypothetical protein BHM03_00020103 [Ensete ventricosum]
MWVLLGSLKLFRTQEPSSLSLVTRFGRTGRPREGRPPFMWLPSRFQKEKEKEKKKKKPPPPFACPQKKSSGDLSGFPMLWYVSDEVMGTFAPIVLYWFYAGFYQLLPRLDRYRLHTKKEEEQKNLVTLPTVVKGVLLQQVVQATIAQVLFLVRVRMPSLKTFVEHHVGDLNDKYFAGPSSNIVRCT